MGQPRLLFRKNSLTNEEEIRLTLLIVVGSLWLTQSHRAVESWHGPQGYIVLPGPIRDGFGRYKTPYRQGRRELARAPGLCSPSGPH